MTRIAADGADNRSATISTQRHRKPGLVVGGFTINICGLLHPARTVPRENPCMPRIAAVAAVAVGADNRSATISTQRHRHPGQVGAGFTINIGTQLHPARTGPRENPCMPRIGAVAIVVGGADDRSATISTQRHRIPGNVAVGFTINICTLLLPGQGRAVPRVNPCMPRIRAVAAVVGGADDRCATISTQRHRIPGLVVGGFTINILTLLRPASIGPRVDPCLPRIGAVDAVLGGADNRGATISTQRHRPPGLVVGGFTINI